jgi:hypothetical protein
MIVRKILLAAGAAALMSTPAWALPSQSGHGPGKPQGPPSTTPNNSDNPGHKDHGDHHGKGHHGKSHRCMPHRVGYVAGGTLVKQTLTKNEDGAYSGEVVVKVTRTNHHAAADDGKTVTYNVTNVHVTFGMEDVNKDGSVGLDDLAEGDRVHVIGKITALAKKCPSGEFTAETIIRKLVFNAPPATPPAGKD